MLAVYSLYQVDAFTTRPLAGNPCAVILDCADLVDDVMLAVAKEMNLSETSFVWRMDDGRFRARYFTPAEEKFAGKVNESHPNRNAAAGRRIFADL
ncbi:MAG TPA: PhzF family phenazine biosynthesis protein [Anaerolineales bacterium]|nr:PhzF family phenazine biosynthesis protein [Anaerolineales bacterium]